MSSSPDAAVNFRAAIADHLEVTGQVADVDVAGKSGGAR
jgi:hypothetical protein